MRVVGRSLMTMNSRRRRCRRRRHLPSSSSANYRSGPSSLRYLLITHARSRRCVGRHVTCDLVCVCVVVCPQSKKPLELSTPNVVLYARTSARVDLEVKRSKVTWLSVALLAWV